MTSKKRGKIWINMGLLLIAAALFLLAYNRYEDGQARKQAAQNALQLESRIKQEKRTEETGEVPDYILNPEMDMPIKKIDGIAYIGILEIPALQLKLPVIRDLTYPHLRIAPCCYAGTAYEGSFVIAAHNYASHFGNISTLKAGDEITFTDVDGNVFTYQVSGVEILEPTAVEEMTAEGWDLTLFTCTLGGKTRVTLRCTLASGIKDVN